MADSHPTQEALVADWKENAKKHDDENYQFLRKLKQTASRSVSE